METLKVSQRVGKDGILHLDIPVGFKDQDVEVMVIYQAVPSEASTVMALEDLNGVCADDPIRMDQSGISDALDEDLAGVFE